MQTDRARTGPIRTVSFVSLGCPKNTVDSEKMLGLLAEAGIAPVSADAVERGEEAGEYGGEHSGEHGAGEHDDLSLAGSEQDHESAAAHPITPADAVVINTCGFLEASKRESLGTIRAAVEAKRRGDVRRVVVAGCLVQRHRAKMLEWEPGIDAMVGVFDRDRVVDAVRGAGEPGAVRTENEPDADTAPRYWIHANALTRAAGDGRDVTGLTVNGKDGKGIGYYESDASRLRLTPRHYAYLRVSEGCNQRCAFCTIPSIRGKMRSKPLDRVADEARELTRDGAFEILLIGQDTTSYGDDLQPPSDRDAADPFSSGLPGLLSGVSHAIREETGAFWLRLMYAYPSTFDERTVDAFAELAARGDVLPYIDIPLQHASDRVLHAMRRNVTAEQQRRLMHMLRERVPGMAIRTTLITGFPGETEDDHAELLEFIEDVGFDALGVFRFSPEPGTAAGTMHEDPALRVPDEIARRRHDEILALQQQLAFEQTEFLAERFDPDDPTETGVRLDVLIDGPAPDRELDDGTPVYRGRTYFQAPRIDPVTYVASTEPLSPGELVSATIVAADGYDLIARPAEQLERRVRLPLA